MGNIQVLEYELRPCRRGPYRVLIRIEKDIPCAAITYRNSFVGTEFVTDQMIGRSVAHGFTKQKTPPNVGGVLRNIDF